jgi:glyoxylase-like metal-dependent hydrolase (beta-lactamase superfamily II)
MKTVLLTLALLLAVGLGALAMTFTPETLPLGETGAFSVPEAHPPEDMTLSALLAGRMLSKAGFAYRGGALSEPRVFGMGGVLVKHPKGTLLFDAGFGRNVDAHFKTIPRLMQATSKYEKETPVADQLRATGLDSAKLTGIVLTHAHWDHVSGIEDLPGVPVWLPQAELDFINSGSNKSGLIRSFGALPYKTYDFSDGPYLGFGRSFDWFGDGSVVLVPAPGHTPGSIIAFISLPDGKRYALVGDLVWQAEGISLPAERPWLSRRLVDSDEAAVRELIVHMHQLQAAQPDLIIVPAHDRRVWEKLPSFPG